MERFEEAALLFDEIYDFLFRNHLSVDPDALSEVNKMRTGVESYFVAFGLENGGQCVRTGAFAVGSGNMDGQETGVRMAEVFVQSLCRTQSFFIGGSTDVLEDGGAGKQVFYSFLVCHGMGGVGGDGR